MECAHNRTSHSGDWMVKLKHFRLITITKNGCVFNGGLTVSVPSSSFWAVISSPGVHLRQLGIKILSYKVEVFNIYVSST